MYTKGGWKGVALPLLICSGIMLPMLLSYLSPLKSYCHFCEKI
eukprot:UN05699